MKFKDFLLKLQNLPENHKKMVLWAIIGTLGIILGYFWVINTLQKISNT